MPAKKKRGASMVRRFFEGKNISLRRELAAAQNALRRAAAAAHRLEAQRARDDTRAWAMNRRARTRHLIELGGLVVKAGLVELTSDDRAVLLGAFLEIADTLPNGNREQITVLWRRRGSRAFRADATSEKDGG